MASRPLMQVVKTQRIELFYADLRVVVAFLLRLMTT
jgi:hypothetical protein